jgi:septum site-determining protein MinC
MLWFPPETDSPAAGNDSVLQHVNADRKSGAASSAAVPLQIRGRSFTAVVLQLTGAPDAEFYAALDAKLAQAPHFFTNAPFVLDLDRATGLDRSGAMVGLARELRARRLAVIGVQNGTIEQNAAALGAGLITLQGGRDAAEPDARGGAPAMPEAPAAEDGGESGTLVITEPVRSGQRVFADRGDLVVVASVSPGAEVIARGNIHIYGRLRGRALAGVNGDLSARIFCQNLEAELIAIAGLYRTSDDLEPAVRNQRVQAYLQDDVLRIEVLK